MKFKIISFKLVFALVFLFASKGISQQVTFAPKEVDDSGYDHIKVIGEDEEGVFVLQSNLAFELDRDRVGFKSRKYKLGYYTNQLNNKWTKQLVVPKENSNIEAVIFIAEKILVLSSLTKKADNQYTIFAQWVNNKGNYEGTLKTINVFTYEKGNDLEKLKIVVSKNSQLLALVLNEFRPNSIIQHVALSDTSLNSFSKVEINVTHEPKNFRFESYALSDRYDFISLGNVSGKNKTTKEYFVNYKLFICRGGETVLPEFNLEVNNHIINGANIAVDNQSRKLAIAGFYEDKESYSGTGVFMGKIDLVNSNGIDLKTKSMNGNSASKMIGERNSAQGMGLMSYDIQRLILRNDGGVVLLAEASYTSEYAYFDYFTQSYMRRIEYHFDNVVALSMNADGTIDWSTLLRKDQASVDDYGVFSSFCSLLMQDKIIVIYNSDISRMNEVSAYTVSTKGKESEAKIVQAADHILLLPRTGRQVSENEIIVPAVQRKKLTLAKITF